MLIKAIKDGDIEICELLINRGCDLNAKDWKKRTPPALCGRGF